MIRLSIVFCLAAAFAFGATGNPQLKSAGPMAFGPAGTLFIGDSIQGAVVAIDTGDTGPASRAPSVHLEHIDREIAGLLGTTPDHLLINDIKVNPLSKNIYLSISRGRGLDAIPVILRVSSSGRIAEFSLDHVTYSTALLPNPPVSNPRADYRNPRLETITQLAYVDGKVIVAGLSNEEFSSNLRIIPFPFRKVNEGASIEIYHGSHGDYETQAPVRTFFPWTIGDKPYIVAAYTCTPLVLIPVSELKPGAKVTGRTIAELGMGNRPLDMVLYRKDNHDYILMANSYRGVLRLSAENLDQYTPITEPEQVAGVPFKRISSLKGVRHLAAFDDANVLVLVETRDPGSNATNDHASLDLESVPLP
jgi:hypothetical protein